MDVTKDFHSPSVKRALHLPRPAWRGRMHKWATPAAGLAALALVFAAEPGVERFAAVIYGFGIIGLYAVSATVHYQRWEPRRLHTLFQADHSMIMLFICASTAPVGLVGVGGTTGWVLFLGMVAVVGAGLLAVWLPFHPPRGFMNTLFLVVGWWPVMFSVAIADGLGSGGLTLLLAGGAVFTIGALVVGFQRPDPNPDIFGYHEIWHVFVIIGSAIHYVLMWLIVSGETPLSI